jgi:hypothetical protein
MKNISLSALDTLPLDELAALPPGVLADLQQEANDSLALARKRSATLVDALDRRYGAVALVARQAAGKDTGTVKLTDGDYIVAVETKKAVHWNGLEKLADKIRAGGDDPAVYIVSETKLTVREAAYKDWPADVRAAFEPYRTVNASRAAYRIERAPEVKREEAA